MENESQVEHNSKISIGVSACLLGEKVRYDGGHKRNQYITELLSEHFNFISYCPEVAIGMSIPREPIRLVDKQGEIRVTGTLDPDSDFTEQLKGYGNDVADSLMPLCGFIFKKNSPSCGMERVEVYAENGIPERRGTGIFAAEIIRNNPLLPVVEESSLNDSLLRANFINRVYVYANLKSADAGGYQ